MGDLFPAVATLIVEAVAEAHLECVQGEERKRVGNSWHGAGSFEHCGLQMDVSFGVLLCYLFAHPAQGRFLSLLHWSSIRTGHTPISYL